MVGVLKHHCVNFGELVMAYKPKLSNDTGMPQAFYALYLYPNENGSGHVVFSLKLKTRRSTQKCIPQPMTQDIIYIVNKIGRRGKGERWDTILRVRRRNA